MEDSIFWERFIHLCETKHKKPTTLGADIGFGASTVGKWKSGSIPNGDALIKISSYFKCSVDYLLGIIDFKQESLIRDIKYLDAIELERVKELLYQLEAEHNETISSKYLPLTHIMNMYLELPKEKKVTIDDLIRLYSTNK